MLCTFDVDYEQIVDNLGRAGLYLPAVIGVWVFVYAFNALAFQIIVNSGTHLKHLSYRHAYKLTVSGFAFSYTTPFGFGGGVSSNGIKFLYRSAQGYVLCCALFHDAYTFSYMFMEHCSSTVCCDVY